MGRTRTDGPTAESVERRLEGRIGASRYRMWFADPTRFMLQGGAPLAELDVSDPRTLFGVDPSRCEWRDGEWREPEGTP